MSDTNNETVIEDSNDTDLRAEIDRLKAKNKELLTEKQKAKQKAQEAQDAVDEAEARSAENSGNVDALKAAHAKELKKLQDKLQANDTDLRTIRVDNELTRSLSEGNVRSEMSEALTALLKSKVQYDNGTATIDGQSIGDFVGSYLGSEVGAHFRRASDNSGGGATGNSNTTATTQFSEGEYIRRYQLNPVEAKQWAVANGQAWITKD